MKLKFLGVGSALHTRLYHSNAILESDTGQRLLIDAGTDIRWSIKNLKEAYAVDEISDLLESINAIYISHLHGDHAGGLEYLAYMYYYVFNKRKISLYIHKDLYDDAKELFRIVTGSGIPSLDDYFNVIQVDESFVAIGTLFQVIKLEHCPYSYGLYWETPNKYKVLFTTDTKFTPYRLMEYYEKADIIFHECETTPSPSGVHSHISDLRTLPINIKSKITIYHCNDKMPNTDGFAGCATQHQWYNLVPF